MVKIVFWTVLPHVGSFLAKGSKQCINLGVGIICGVAQAVGVEVFTKDSLNEALALKSAADVCKEELPIKLTTEHDEVSEIMKEGGKTAVSKAKAVMKSSGVDEKCIEIFGLVSTKRKGNQEVYERLIDDREFNSLEENDRQVILAKAEENDCYQNSNWFNKLS